MKKRNLKDEKRITNELYAKKFQKEDDRKKRKNIGRNWCRIKEHPQSCNCVYV